MVCLSRNLCLNVVKRMRNVVIIPLASKGIILYKKKEVVDAVIQSRTQSAVIWDDQILRKAENETSAS